MPADDVPVLRRWSRGWLWAIAAIWLGSATTGLFVVWAYDNQPGPSAAAPASWPSGTPIIRALGRPTVVLLAHPRCSCTEATLGELAQALARTTVYPKTYVLFLRPPGFAEGWEHTGIWRLASTLPDATLVADDRGIEARRFGALTSGQLLVYDADGRLVFNGGITGSRGHRGDNPGRAALITAIDGARDPHQARVFGCSLFEPAGGGTGGGR